MLKSALSLHPVVDREATWAERQVAPAACTHADRVRRIHVARNRSYLDAWSPDQTEDRDGDAHNHVDHDDQRRVDDHLHAYDHQAAGDGPKDCDCDCGHSHFLDRTNDETHES